LSAFRRIGHRGPRQPVLGVPFWFDLLKKFMVVRSTIKPREKSQTEPSKD
jgi:hypothetical protein